MISRFGRAGRARTNHGAIQLQHLKAISITTEQRELSLGQWLAMTGQILSILAQALIGKES